MIEFCLRKHWECSDDLLRQLPVPQWMQDHPDQYKTLLAQQVQHGKCDLSLYGCWHETPDALGLKNDDVIECCLAARWDPRDQLYGSLHELWLQESRRKWAFSLRARNPFGGVAPEAHGARALPCAAMVHGHGYYMHEAFEAHTWHDANVTWFTTAGVYWGLFITKIYTTLLLNVLCMYSRVEMGSAPHLIPQTLCRAEVTYATAAGPREWQHCVQQFSYWGAKSPLRGSATRERHGLLRGGHAHATPMAPG